MLLQGSCGYGRCTRCELDVTPCRRIEASSLLNTQHTLGLGRKWKNRIDDEQKKKKTTGQTSNLQTSCDLKRGIDVLASQPTPLQPMGDTSESAKPFFQYIVLSLVLFFFLLVLILFSHPNTLFLSIVYVARILRLGGLERILCCFNLAHTKRLMDKIAAIPRIILPHPFVCVCVFALLFYFDYYTILLFSRVGLIYTI